MPQNSLIKYVREQIKAGYNTRTIKRYLLKYGYTESKINEAFKQAYPPTEVKHVIHPSKTTVILTIAIIGVIAAISLAIFMYLIPEKAPSQLLDLEIDSISPTVQEGGTLQFTVEISNLGKAKRYDVPIKYEVYNLRDQLVTFKEETIALETRASSSVSIELANIKAGSYYLKTTASYDEKTAKATSSFNVVKKGITQVTEPEITEPEKRCPLSCDDNNECTNDYCSEATNYVCRNDITSNCCGNNICEANENYESCLADCQLPTEKVESIFEGKTVWEKVDLIKEIAKSDKTKALEYCKEIEQLTYKYQCFINVGVSTKDQSICLNIEDEPSKDNCYKEIAKEIQGSSVCGSIAKESKKDQCYMEFITKGDYTLCDKLVNPYLQRSCNSLKKISEAQPT